jgi:hypothetical protein
MVRKAGFISEISCAHQYTLVNFLNWYFLGTPQKSFIEASSRSLLFNGSSAFEERMNRLCTHAEAEFQEILAETFTGDSLCCAAARSPERI